MNPVSGIISSKNDDFLKKNQSTTSFARYLAYIFLIEDRLSYGVNKDTLLLHKQSENNEWCPLHRYLYNNP